MNSSIFLKDVEIRAFHGVFPQEKIIGNTFIINLEVFYDFQKAAEQDCLDDTIDYVSLFEIIKSEMAIPSKLIENVGHRIISVIESSFPLVEKIEITIQKQAPAIGGRCDSSGIKISKKRTH